tara:strand:+ start:6202 stop:6411 length:210 start_codon:yes stop_codon:yes gene_type:complete
MEEWLTLVSLSLTSREAEVVVGHRNSMFRVDDLALQPRKFKRAHVRFKEQRRSTGDRALLHRRHQRRWD